jgi:DNA topoisomerase VI subunit A
VSFKLVAACVLDKIIENGAPEPSACENEIEGMLSTGLKYELDALANKDFQYLTKTYLPRKLKEKDWLD